MIGIISAMDLEIITVRNMMTETVTETVSGVTFTKGKLCGKDVVTAVCGIGKVFASLCAEAMILRYSPEAVINVGVAGTLTPLLGVGDIAVGSAAVCHDMDTTALGDPPGFISGIGLVRIPLSEELGAKFEKVLADSGIVHLRGAIASGDRFVWEREEKERIARDFDAVACEMEGQAIAQTAFVNRVPCAILRSISDSLDGGAADYEQFKHFAAERTARVIEAFFTPE